MNTQTLMRLSGMVLLAIAVSLIMLAMVYVVQGHHMTPDLASVSWNG